MRSTVGYSRSETTLLQIPRVVIVLLLPVLLVVAGTTGYALIEGWPVMDALYMAVITISTVGYNEVATSDDVLKRAGVERARSLVTVAASDADNLYITMSARLLNDRLHIVARAEDEGAQTKLLRSGASRVISPYVIGGQRVAQAVLRPTVLDFIELATRSEHLELQMEEVAIWSGSRLAGLNLKDSQIRQDLGIIIVAIKRLEGRMVFNPAPDELLTVGDVLIALGHRQQLDRLEQIAKP
jgi:voltage-gated potassium channel